MVRFYFVWRLSLKSYLLFKPADFSKAQPTYFQTLNYVMDNYCDYPIIFFKEVLNAFVLKSPRSSINL